MQFLQLYGIELDRELGTTDSTVLFTAVRRKAAINAAQQEFVTRTDCLKRQGTLPIVDGTQEYDLEVTFTDVAWLQAQDVSLKIVRGTTTRYLEGPELTRTTVERLDDDEPNWRAVAASTPRTYYLRPDGGATYLGFHPAPKITGSDVWTGIVPYVAVPADLSGDTDEPFTIASNPIKTLRPFHRALVHFAAYDLEKLRKDTTRSAAQLQLWEIEVAKYLATMKPKSGGQRVRFLRNYRRTRFSGSNTGIGTITVAEGAFDSGFE